VHVDAWLRDHGWLALKDGKRTGRIASGDVDWTKTRAYGIGFNSVYLNLQGREARASCARRGRRGRGRALAAAARVHGSEDGKAVVRRVFRGRDAFHGPRVAEGPT
jgi:predicted AlkP superfamily phosphohydrolase/phosphomutase